ncbi:MAG: hypothetical protein M3X11_13630 [Acidobacteriota bacterium]|nr:hypothetical protein [Acidobacteriota bacterium]
MNFMMYLLGTLIVVIAVAYGLSRLGVSSTWIWIGAAIVLGLGIMTGVTKTRQKDPPA